MDTYSVCITPVQHARLFGPGRPKPRRIGCGIFGCAYPTSDPTKVVKITADATDVGAMQRAQGLPRVPTLYGVYRLTSPTWWGRTLRPTSSRGPRVFAMVVERLRPLSDATQKRFDEAMGCIRKHARRGTDPADSARACCFVGRAWGLSQRDIPSCRRLAADLTEAVKDFGSVDLNIRDLHTGNIGIDKKGRWKVLDLGISGEPPGEVATLHGRRRRKRRR